MLALDRQGPPPEGCVGNQRRLIIARQATSPMIVHFTQQDGGLVFVDRSMSTCQQPFPWTGLDYDY